MERFAEELSELFKAPLGVERFNDVLAAVLEAIDLLFEGPGALRHLGFKLVRAHQ
jgi:hypothetical protein